MKQRLEIEMKIQGEFPVDDEADFINTLTRAIRATLRRTSEHCNMGYMEAEYYSARRSRASKRKMAVQFSSKPETGV